MKAQIFFNGCLVARDIKIKLPKGWRTKFTGEDHVDVTVVLFPPEGNPLWATGKAVKL